jgi:hypothetical protein
LHRGGGESIQRYRDALRLNPMDPAARSGLATALKSRNPVYGALLRYEIWLGALPTGQRWATRIGPLVALRIVFAISHGPIATGLGALVPILFATAWGAEPVCNLLLLFDPTDRVLLSPGQRHAALAFAGFALLAIGSFVGASQTRWLVPYGFGFALWALVSGMVHTTSRPVVRQLLIVLSLAGLVGGLTGLALLGVGNHPASVAAATVAWSSAILAAFTAAIAR